MPNYSRYKSSITNNTRVFSIMNGLAPRSYSGRINSRATKKLVIPADPEEGLEYMKKHNILSKNPACSGGVGRINTTACTSKDGLFMSVVPRNYQYRPLYNHIYKSNDTTTHHVPCERVLQKYHSGFTVGKISDQKFDASGNPKVTKNIFMCDFSSDNPDPCTTELEDVYAFNASPSLIDATVPFCLNPEKWDGLINDCRFSLLCAQRDRNITTITVDSASGFIGILAILSISESNKPIEFTQVKLTGSWVIPKINMNIYYPSTNVNPSKPYFHILPDANITNKAHITVLNSYLYTTLFHIEGSFTNHGTIKYQSLADGVDSEVTFFDISGTGGKLTNGASGEIIIPDISSFYYPRESIKIFNILNGGHVVNDGNITIGNISNKSYGFFANKSTITNTSKIKIGEIQDGAGFHLTNSSTLLNNNNITLGNIKNGSSGFYADNSPITNTSNTSKIKIGEIQDSWGFHLTNRSTLFNHNNITLGNIRGGGGGAEFTSTSTLSNVGPITLGNISDNGMGIVFTGTSTLSNDGPITLGTIDKGSSGFYAENSELTNTSDITLGTIDNSSSGFFANKSTITNTSNTSKIKIGEIHYSWGFHLTNGSKLFNHNNITLDNISNNGKGIQFTGTSTLSNDGPITLGNISDNGTGIQLTNASTLSNDGPITLGTIDTGSSGFFANKSTITNTSNTSNTSKIKIGEIQDSKGFHLTNGSTLFNHNNITLDNISNNGTGIQFTGTSTLSNDGPITLGTIDKGSSGFYAENSELTNTSDITLGTIDNSSSGFFANKSTITNTSNTSKIKIGEIHYSWGFHLTNGSKLFNHNNITLDNISNNGKGIQFTGTSTLSNDGPITLGNISDNGTGIQLTNASTLSNDGPITLGTIDTGSSGFFANKSSFSFTNKSDISLGVIHYSWGFHLTNGSTLSNDGPITLGNINNGSHGFFSNDSSFSFTNTSKIKIGEIHYSWGFHLTNGSTLSNDGAITGGFMVGSYGVDLSGSIITNNGSITLGNISDNGTGIQLTNASTLSNDGPITLGTIDTGSSGFFSNDSSFTNKSDITLGPIQDSRGFHLTNSSTLLNNFNINFDTIGGNVESVGLLRDASSSIINNNFILFTEISGKAVGVVAEIPSILPHEIMGGYGKIDVSNIYYQDVNNIYTYAFGKRGIALTRALMNSITNQEDYYCPITHPYAYVDVKEAIIKNDSDGEVWSTDGDDAQAGKVYAQCCSVQPRVTGIAKNWKGYKDIPEFKNKLDTANLVKLSSAYISAPRHLARDKDQCNTATPGRGWTGNQKDGVEYNGGWMTKISCPEGASISCPDAKTDKYGFCKSVPGTQPTDIMTTRMYTIRNKLSGGFPASSYSQRVKGFGYGWSDFDYVKNWNICNKVTSHESRYIKPGGMDNNAYVYCIPWDDGKTPYNVPIFGPNYNDFLKNGEMEDTLGGADKMCASLCNKHTSCTSYSLMPYTPKNGFGDPRQDYDGKESAILFYCLGRNDGYNDYTPVQGWGYEGKTQYEGPGLRVYNEWNAELTVTSGNHDRTYHFNELCTRTRYNTWPPSFSASTVGFVTSIPKIAPIVTMSGKVNNNSSGDDAGKAQYTALKPGTKDEQWCHFDKKSFPEATTEDECYRAGKCWQGDLDFGGCYAPTPRDDGGVLSLEKIPSVGAEAGAGCNNPSSTIINKGLGLKYKTTPVGGDSRRVEKMTCT
jgi:hypothetical protein